MPNPRRGEVAVELGGKRHALCLTLGALAELEHAFGVADLAALGERFAGGRLSARDLLTLLAVGCAAAGMRSPTRRSRRCRSTAASRRSPARSAIASPPRSGASRQTLRSRRRRERAVALPVGGGDGVRPRPPAVEPARVLARDAARARRGGTGRASAARRSLRRARATSPR